MRLGQSVLFNRRYAWDCVCVCMLLCACKCVCALYVGSLWVQACSI